jgi:integrase
MSVYLAKRKDGTLKSPFYQYDFIETINGEHRRFHGSTRKRDKKKALEAEQAIRARVTSGKPNDAMTLATAILRYVEEVAKYQPSSDDTSVAFAHCSRLIGGGRLLVNVTADDIAKAARQRAAESYGKETKKLVSAATVNRQIVEPMRRLMGRAKRAWDMSCDPDRIEWKALKFKEPKERVREFIGDEGDRFWAALRRDYYPIVWFLAHRGFRVRAALGMRRQRVDVAGRRVQVWQKGEGMVWRPLTAEQAIVIAQELNRSTGDAVWTYEGRRKDKRGARHPITYYGLRRVIRNALKKAGITDFRIHDLRHDFASKLLRATRDLAMVRKAMGHADIASTARYAHVLDEDVAAGMEALSRNANRISDETSEIRLKKIGKSK